MASLPDDNRFLLLKGLRQTLHLSPQEEKSASSEVLTKVSDSDAKDDTGEENQKLRRRSDRARATSAVGLGCHMDLESAVPLPAKLETLGKALSTALDEASDARPPFKALVEEGYSNAATAPVTSQFILRSFANDLSSLSKLVTSETLLAELRQGTSLLSQAMALRWDLTGETRALQQLANAFVASQNELTNATAAEFGLALATAIALSQPEVADRLLAFASEHIADDADPGLIRDALHCMDAGRLLQTMPAVIQSVWQQRLRFADRDWNWDTTESRRVLNSLARVIRPDSLSLPLFKRIVPEELWTKMFSQGESFAAESATVVDDPGTEDFRIEEATPVPAAKPVAEKKSEPEVKSEPVGKIEPAPGGAPASKDEQPEAKKAEPAAEQATTADKPATSPPKPGPEVATPPPAAETQPAKSAEPKPTPAAEAPKESKPEKEAEMPAQPAKPVSDASAAPAAAAAPPAKASSPAPKAKLEPTTDPAPKADTPPAPAAPVTEKPTARSGFLTFVAGAIGGLLVAFALWSALPPKLQTLASAAAIELEPTSPVALAPSAPSKNAEPVAPPSTPAPVVAPTPAPAAPAPVVAPPPVVVPEAPPSPPKTVATTPPPPAPTRAPKPEAPVPVVPTPPKPAPEPNKPAVAKTEPAKVPSTPSVSTPPASPQPAPVMAAAPSKPAPAPEAKKEAPAPEPKKPEPAAATVSKPEEMAGPPKSAAPKVAEVKPTPPMPSPVPAPTPPAPKPVAPPASPPVVVSKAQVAPPFEIWKQKRVVEILSQHPSMKDWAFTAQNRSLRDSTHLILGKHPLIPHKSSVHQSLLTLLVLDPPKDPDAARASLTMFSRVCPPSLCLEVWEPMVEAKMPQTDDIRRAAGVMVELMSIQLSAATRQRLERLAHGK